MKREEEKTNRYFQAVSRFFCELRGAPFFLSSKEVENIREWHNLDIPLPVVREGIKDCFVTHRKKPGRKGKILSLAFCHPFVMRAYKAFKERKVGSKKKAFDKKKKQEELKREVKNFLASCPQSYTDLQEIFVRVLNCICDSADEDYLEELENEVEAFIIKMASEAEREQIRKEVMVEFGSKSPQEQDRIIDIKLIKYFREKYEIPHISLYYY
jgi:hypothetical protein